MLTIAIAKGRIQDALYPFMSHMGVSAADWESRKLIIEVPEQGFKLILLKSADIPTYVAQGSVDLGIVGKDVLLESNSHLFEIQSLPFAGCRLCIAGPKEKSQSQKILRVATKYPVITKQIFKSRGEKIQIIDLEGSVEIAPLIGLSDCIVDIVESGSTLKANHLEIYETLMDIMPLIVANPIGYKTKQVVISAWLSSLQQYLLITTP